jgi:Mor family transcriptional regulator
MADSAPFEPVVTWSHGFADKHGELGLHKLPYFAGIVRPVPGVLDGMVARSLSKQYEQYAIERVLAHVQRARKHDRHGAPIGAMVNRADVLAMFDKYHEVSDDLMRDTIRAAYAKVAAGLPTLTWKELDDVVRFDQDGVERENATLRLLLEAADTGAGETQYMPHIAVLSPDLSNPDIYDEMPGVARQTLARVSPFQLMGNADWYMGYVDLHKSKSTRRYPVVVTTLADNNLIVLITTMHEVVDELERRLNNMNPYKRTPYFVVDRGWALVRSGFGVVTKDIKAAGMRVLSAARAVRGAHFDPMYAATKLPESAVRLFLPDPTVLVRKLRDQMEVLIAPTNKPYMPEMRELLNLWSAYTAGVFPWYGDKAERAKLLRASLSAIKRGLTASRKSGDFMGERSIESMIDAHQTAMLRAGATAKTCDLPAIEAIYAELRKG